MPMAQQVTLDFSELGLLNIRATVGGLSTDVIHLRNISSMGPMNVTFTSPATARPDATQVHIAIQGRPGGKDLDIQDITSPVYADTQALIDDITANIAAMYAGGGGGGVASVSADAPLDSSGGANPTISIDLTGASDGDVLTVDTGAAVWAPAAAAGITSINLNVGPAIELRIPLDAMWAQINNAGSPAAGEFEATSNNDATAVTSLTFHSTDAGGNDQTAFFTSMRIGGLLTGRQTNNDGTNASGSPCIYRVTAVPTLASSQYTIAVAHVSGQFIGSFPNWYVSYAGNGPKVYRAILSQSGTDNPVAVELQNDIGTITWARDDVGVYLATSAALFTANKTYLGNPLLDIGAVVNEEETLDFRYSSTSQLTLYVLNADPTPVDGLGRAWIEVIVYP